MHRLSSIDPENRQGDCSICGPVKLVEKGKTSTGASKFRCYTQAKVQWDRRDALRREQGHNQQDSTAWRKAVLARIQAMRCERVGCDFVAENTCQLDVDHVVRRIDGGTDDPDNLMVLCANCHRLKTLYERRGMSLLPKVTQENTH